MSVYDRARRKGRAMLGKHAMDNIDGMVGEVRRASTSGIRHTVKAAKEVGADNRVRRLLKGLK